MMHLLFCNMLSFPSHSFLTAVTVAHVMISEIISFFFFAEVLQNIHSSSNLCLKSPCACTTSAPNTPGLKVLPCILSHALVLHYLHAACTRKTNTVFQRCIYPHTAYFLLSNLVPFLQTPVPIFSLKPQIV